MKHLGLNVACDPLPTLGYVGVTGGMVVVSAGDPGCHTSPNEQDHRPLAQMFRLPLFDPATPEEARRMTRAAFELSEAEEVPVILRPTTRVAHTRGVVRTDAVCPPEMTGELVRDSSRYVPVPAHAPRLAQRLLDALDRIRDWAEDCPFNRLEGQGPLGIVCSGVAENYLRDVLEELDAWSEVTLLKLGLVHPLPPRLVNKFLSRVERVLVVEELEPYLERLLLASAARLGRPIPIWGKTTNHLPVVGEYEPGVVRRAVATFLGRDQQEPLPLELSRQPLPARPPVLCAGCPHRATYYAIKLAAAGNAIYMNDIGCYTLGVGPPLNMADFLICMGSSITKGSGMSRTLPGRTPVAFVGDSTFFHSAMPGLVNAVYNGHDLLVVVVDNKTTGMTGSQPNPGTGWTGMGEQRPAASIENICRACGVSHLATVDPMDLPGTYQAVQDAFAAQGVRVLISRRVCPVNEARRQGRGVKQGSYAIDHHRCKRCGNEAEGLHCGLQTSRDHALHRSRTRVRQGSKGHPGLVCPEHLAPEPAPCVAACPANICAKGYIGRIAEGRLDDAYALIRGRIPFPSVCGRVCHHPCEEACLRGQLDAPEAIHTLKRFVADQGGIQPVAPAQKVGRVAVVGAGPAGLTAAHDLSLRGYEVTLLDADSQPGGLLSRGIPAYRLPRSVLEREIGQVLTLGINYRSSQALGRDFTLDDLEEDGFDAIFLALGAGPGLRPEIEGGQARGVTDAIEFLAEVSEGRRESVDGPVVVVGGGYAAVDAARSALRLGATSATVVYRRSREEMPAQREEAVARDEGVEFVYLAAAGRLVTDDGQVQAVECQRMKQGEPDRTGRRRPVPGQGQFTLPAQLVIAAIGQQPELSMLADQGVALTRRGYVGTKGDHGATSRPGVFAGGDMVSGPATVIEAIVAGKRGAHGIDLYLSGDRRPVAPLHFHKLHTATPAALDAETNAAACQPRVAEPHLPVAERMVSFPEVDQGYDAAGAQVEAARCLDCSPCSLCDNCLENLGCPAIGRLAGQVTIDDNLCIGCGLCAQLCPNQAIYQVT
jgi:indolepyruvate ferredoxin oxidoreductase alpha subunit